MKSISCLPMFLRYPGGKSKAVTFSYDDGSKHDIRLSKIFTEHNIKATFNLNSFNMRRGYGITEDEIRENILEKGHEIAIHGFWHRAEGNIRVIDGIRDVLECRLELEREFGIIVRGMAYPGTGITSFTNNTTYEKIRTYLGELDIAYARTLEGDNNKFELPGDWYSWMPTAHHNNPDIMEYIDDFLKLDLSVEACPYREKRGPRLFYVWGHSFEFNNDNNWDHIEKICDKFAKAKDIWFATNIEIYNYVNAYNSLVHSADGTIVYNPTIYDIWFDVDGVTYKIGSNCTLRF